MIAPVTNLVRSQSKRVKCFIVVLIQTPREVSIRLSDARRGLRDAPPCHSAVGCARAEPWSKAASMLSGPHDLQGDEKRPSRYSGNKTELGTRIRGETGDGLEWHVMNQPERIFRKRFSAIVGCGGFVLLALLCAAPAFPQAAATAQNVPNLPYKAVPNFFETPPADYLGESQGVATNSKGDIFVFFRGTPGSRLWEFDQTGKFVREIGKGYYGFLFAHMVRVDAQDNIWTVDEGTNVITKFSPDGSKILMVLGYRPSVMDGVVATRHAPNPPGEQ